MVKFRCQRCAQKIAVNIEGADTVIACPNCADNLVVPLESAPEFFEAESIALQLVKADEIAPQPHAPRTVFAQQMARLLGSRLVQVLWFQRQTLFQTQQDETHHVMELEQRLAQVRLQFENRVSVYEVRIAQLEQALGSREEENRELSRANIQLVRRVRDLENAREPARVSLRDAGFLLRT